MIKMTSRTFPLYYQMIACYFSNRMALQMFHVLLGGQTFQRKCRAMLCISWRAFFGPPHRCVNRPALHWGSNRPWWARSE